MRTKELDDYIKKNKQKKAKKLLEEIKFYHSMQIRDGEDYSDVICEKLDKLGNTCKHKKKRKPELDTDKVRTHICEECGTLDYEQI